MLDDLLTVQSLYNTGQLIHEEGQCNGDGVQDREDDHEDQSLLIVISEVSDQVEGPHDKSKHKSYNFEQ